MKERKVSIGGNISKEGVEMRRKLIVCGVVGVLCVVAFAVGKVVSAGRDTPLTPTIMGYWHTDDDNWEFQFRGVRKGYMEGYFNQWPPPIEDFDAFGGDFRATYRRGRGRRPPEIRFDAQVTSLIGEMNQAYRITGRVYKNEEGDTVMTGYSAVLGGSFSMTKGTDGYGWIW